MINDRHQIGLERADLRSVARTSTQHAQNVIRMSPFRIGRQRVQSGSEPAGPCCRNTRSRQHQHSLMRVMAIRHAGQHQAHRFDRRHVAPRRRQLREQAMRLDPRGPERRPQVRPLVKILPQQCRGFLKAKQRHKVLQVMPPNDETTGFTIDMAQNRIRSDDIVQSGIHEMSPLPLHHASTNGTVGTDRQS